MSCVLCSPVAGAARALRLVRCASQRLHPQSHGRARGQPLAEGTEEDDSNRPIQFSSSKANPLQWMVEHSLGRVQQRPWWKVLPLSVSFLLLLVWCCLKQEGGSDEVLNAVKGEETEPRDGSEEPGTGNGART